MDHPPIGVEDHTSGVVVVGGHKEEHYGLAQVDRIREKDEGSRIEELTIRDVNKGYEVASQPRNVHAKCEFLTRGELQIDEIESPGR
jgi:hypothetical protein